MSGQPRKKWDVFVSHATPDEGVARRITAALRDAGWRPFLAVEHLDGEVGTGPWSKAIDAALDDSTALVLLVSPSAFQSNWVEYEWRTIHDDILSGSGGLLVPVCVLQLGPQDLPRALRRYQAVDLRGARDFDAGIRRIEQLLGSHLTGKVDSARPLQSGKTPVRKVPQESLDRLVEVVDAANEALRVIHTEADAKGKGIELRQSLLSFASGAGVYETLFKDAGPNLDGAVSRSRTAANMSSLAGEKDAEEMLQQMLHEYICFALFHVGLTIGAESEKALAAELRSVLTRLEPSSRQR